MIFLGIFLGLIIFAAMVFMAINKKSNFPTRIASLIALAVMIITIIVCLSLVLLGGKTAVDESIVLVGAYEQETAPKTDNGNLMILLLQIIILIGLFILLIVLSMREHRKNNLKENSKKTRF